MTQPETILETPGFGGAQEVDKDGNLIVPAAPRKKPHHGKHTVASQIDFPNYSRSRGRSRTPPHGNDGANSSRHKGGEKKRRETSLDRAEQMAGELARAIARREREITEFKNKLKEAEKNLRSRTENSLGGKRDRTSHHDRDYTSTGKKRSSPRRERSVSMEKRKRHARDRYERSDSNARRERDRHEKSDHRRHQGFEGRALEAPRTAREAAREALSKIGVSPLAHWIRTEKTPSRVKHATFTLYETTSDPVAHLQHYLQAMFMHEQDDALLCKMFPSSLGKIALAWYHKLPAGSILCWSQLAEEFVARFLTSRAAPKTFDVLP